MGGPRWRIAFVSPRWAPDAAGGAEVLSRLLAERLCLRGHAVEALTTCAEDPHTWANIRPAGTEVINSVTVRRFPVDPGRMPKEFLSIQNRISLGHKVTREDEERWIGGSAVSDGLNSYLHRHREEYDAFIFVPYLFGVTWSGSQICPEKSLLIPCLHDEPFAYLSIYRDMFRRFRGFLFNSAPEMELAQRLYQVPEDRSFLVSMGFEEKGGCNAAGFRRKTGISDPFLLYAGRREGGKNTPLLVKYFHTFRRRTGRPLKLVLLGSGETGLGGSDRDEILDLGFVPEKDKRDAMAACLVFCQPSVNESFSIVLMESWLAGRPVLVHGSCDVTRRHVEESNGGLWFDDYLTFEECVGWFLDHPTEADAMAGSGKSYVRRNYSWEAVLQRFEKALEKSLLS
jgi:glycosyltransferase involved in cell wall biosynthesis